MIFVWIIVAAIVGIVLGAALAGRRTEIYANALRLVMMLTEPARLSSRNRTIIVDESTWIQIRTVVREALREGL
jgi:hypothetical protein